MFRNLSLVLGAALATVSAGVAHASTIGDAIGGGNFDPFGVFSYDSTTLLNLFGMESAAAVPVPAALPLLGSGIVALGLAAARKRRKNAADSE